MPIKSLVSLKNWNKWQFSHRLTIRRTWVIYDIWFLLLENRTKNFLDFLNQFLHIMEMLDADRSRDWTGTMTILFQNWFNEICLENLFSERFKWNLKMIKYLKAWYTVSRIQSIPLNQNKFQNNSGGKIQRHLQ